MLAFLTDLVAAVALPPHTDSFALELLDLAHTWHGDIDFFDILRLAAVDIFIKRDTASLQQPQALRALSALLTAIAELLAMYQPITLQRCTQRGQFSRSRARSFRCWRSQGTTLPLLRLPLGLKSSDVVYLSWKKNSSCCRSTRTSLQRHQRYWLVARVSLQKLTSGTTPPAQLPWPAKSERPPGSSPPSSGSAWILWQGADCFACCPLLHLSWKSAALHPLGF